MRLTYEPSSQAGSRLADVLLSDALPLLGRERDQFSYKLGRASTTEFLKEGVPSRAVIPAAHPSKAQAGSRLADLLLSDALAAAAPISQPSC